MSPRPYPGPLRGFSLTEVFIALGIVTMLAALLAPAFLHVRQRGQAAQCLIQMRRWVAVVQGYAAEHGTYPSYAASTADGTLWYTTVTSYIRDRTDIHCPQKKKGRPEFISYNIYLGWDRANVDARTKPYRKVSPAMVREPSATVMFTDGASSAERQSDGTGSYVYRKVRTGYNHGKHQGGANWAFCDGHGEWITRERALELGGPDGDAYPFVRPF